MKYLFYISKKYSIPIIIPLVKELKKISANYSFYVSDKVRNAFPKIWKKSLILNNIQETKKFNPDFVLCPGNFVDFRIPGVKVQLFHGLGVEKASHYKIRHFFDIYLTSGPYVTKKFSLLQKKYKYFDVFETGWPKIDFIINFPTENLHEQLNIPLEKKVILYAPTFSSKMESVSDLLETIPKIIKKNEFWLFKFHELMNANLINELRTNLINKFPNNILIIKNQDITPYLHIADTMLSDTSSVIYEFLVLDKPVITYQTIARKDKGINITEPGQLRAALDSCLQNPNILSKQRKRNIAEINPNTNGNISKKIIEKLESTDVKKYPKKNKPLNLFRKLQIIYHSIFRKGYLR